MIFSVMDAEDVGVWLVQYPIVVREAINGSTYLKKNKDHDGLTQLCLCIPGLSFIAPRSEIQGLASLCIGKLFGKYVQGDTYRRFSR